MLNNLLDPQLAQQIVNRTMQIIDCNINVMDNKGYIIGSGDPKRIGELHEGALLVLSQKRIVTITEDSVKTLFGAKPGVNLPLTINNHLVGVIGLTGDPKQLFQFGELVKMSAEMMMEQASLINEMTKNKRLHEDIVLHLIQNEQLPNHLKEWSTRIGVDLSIPRVVAIIDIETGQLGIETAMDQLNQLHNYLLKLDSSNLVAIKSLSCLVLLMPALNTFGYWDAIYQKQKMYSLVDKIKKINNLNIKISLGNFFTNDTSNITKSYQTALAALAIGKERAPNTCCYVYQDYLLPTLLNTLEASWQTFELTRQLNKLKSADTSEVLIDTLKIWFKNNLQATDTANELAIHRNTLEYRLKKISEITQLDMKLFENQLLLYLALTIQEK